MIVYHPTPSGAERSLTQLYAYTSPGGVTRLPAMMAQLQVHIDGRTVYRFRSGEATVCSGPVVVGASTGHVEMEMPAGARLVGVGLLAEGWRTLVGMPADLATDRALPVRSIWPSSRASALEDVAAVASSEEALGLLRTIVLEGLAAGPGSDPRLKIVERWLQKPGRPVVDDLLGELSLSLRHVERLVKGSHGLPPRLLERKYRTLRVAHAMAIGQDAQGCSGEFYDQSHLIQNFKQFVGTTPSRFKDEDRFLARHLLKERWKAGARHRLALWG